MLNSKTRSEIIDEIIKYFDDNPDDFTNTIEELDNYNGYLNDDRYYDMYLLSEFYQDVDPIDLLNRAYFGYDYDSWYTDERGDKHYDSFNPNREYFTYNGYGNLCSTNYKDYSDHLDHYFVEKLIEDADQLYDIPDEVKELIEEYNTIEEVED